MDVSGLRHYGRAFSEAESAWPDDVKARMRKDGQAVVMRELGFFEKLRFGFAFGRARKRAARADLSTVRARGLDDPVFLAIQLEYLALFSALAEVCGTERAIAICKEIMRATVREPMLLCLPEPEKVRALGDPLTVFRHYFRPSPEAARRAGCNELEIVEDSDQAVQFDVKWCVWLELARAVGVPEACLPNCYSDDLVFPDYFEALGMRYVRTGTLAGGARCCDFRFERRSPGGD